MATVAQLLDDWYSTHKKLTDEQKALEKERKPLADELDAFVKNKPSGLIGKLTHALTSTAGMAPLREKIENYDTRIGNTKYNLGLAAQKAYDELEEIALDMPENKPMLAGLNKMEQALDMLREAAQEISKTITKCNDAISYEQYDRYRDSRDATNMSFHATAGARKSVKATKALLNKLSEQLKQLDFGDSGVGEMTSLFDYEGAPELSDGFGRASSDRVNWLNSMEMQKSIRHMESAQASVDKSLRQFEASRDKVIAKALANLREDDPASDELAAAVTPYLPNAQGGKGYKPGGPSR
jgi:hypothetical protein